MEEARRQPVAGGPAKADALLELPSQPLVTEDALKFALFGRADVDDDVFDEVKAFAQFAADRHKKGK